MKELIRTCCKINLFLQVTGKRQDNYHTLYTLFLPVKDMYDEIECDFNSAPGIRVEVKQTSVPGGRENDENKAQPTNFAGIWMPLVKLFKVRLL